MNLFKALSDVLLLGDRLKKKKKGTNVKKTFKGEKSTMFKKVKNNVCNTATL